MAIYFDFKTIEELTGNNYYRQEKEFTLEDLAQYDGSNGNPAYVAIEGIVYDIGNAVTWGGETHFGLTAGQDLTEQFNSCHGIMDILNNAPKVGILIDDDMNNGFITQMNRQVKQDTSKFTPDDWIRYINPLVNYALRENIQGISPQGINAQRSYEKIILLGVLVGLGKNPLQAIEQVEQWQKTGASQLLKSGTGTSGSMGAVGTMMGSGAGTGTVTGGTGTGGTGISGGTTTGGVTGTSGGTMTGSGTGTGISGSNTSNRLYFD